MRPINRRQLLLAIDDAEKRPFSGCRRSARDRTEKEHSVPGYRGK